MQHTTIDGDQATADTAPAGGAMLANHRRLKILEWLQEQASGRVRELAETFSVSKATIRQDLDRLASDGHVVREHGGAYLQSAPSRSARWRCTTWSTWTPSTA